MSVNPDIHDKAYQFFIEEAAELLQIIEDGILELRRDRGANTVHAVMRAAHSIKGGAASVELEAIKTIAHRMETAFRALYDETVEIDDELEGLLLDGFDCLKDPLNEQIDTGSHDPEAALDTAMPVIEALEAKLGADVLKQADNYIPSSSDLGIDMVTSIFEIDVEEGIAHLDAVAENPENFPVLGELQAQAEVFIGFGELLDLPGFGAIAQAILNACHHSPDDPIALLTIALQDLHAAKELVMGGDRDQGGAPSEALLALAGGSSSGTASDTSSADVALSAGDFADFGLSEADLANFDFANGDLSALTDSQNEVASAIDSQTSELDSNLTDAGLGELDLAALTMEGDALLDTAEASRADNNLSVEESVRDDAAGFDFGSNDFQALIDESSGLELSTGQGDELATIEQAETSPAAAQEAAPFVDEPFVDEPLVNELDADQAESVDFASLDAMAQLADLMAEPDASQAESQLEAIASEADAGMAPFSGESGFGEEETADSSGAGSQIELEAVSLEDSFTADDNPTLGMGDGIEDEPISDSVPLESTFDLVTEAVALGIDPEPQEEEQSRAVLESEPPDFNMPEGDVLEEAAVSDELSLTDSAELLEDAVFESPAPGLAAPDAELENMWAELDDNLGDNFSDDAQESNLLDQTFEMAADEAEQLATEITEQSQEVSEAFVSREEELADIFENEAIAPIEEQDNTTPLSVAEADAAFEALVDASTANEANGLDDSALSLDLSFDDDEDAEPSVPVTDDSQPVPVADKSQNLEDIFTLENVAEIEPANGDDSRDILDPIPNPTSLESSDADESSVSTNSLDEGQGLIDPWASQALEAAEDAQLASEAQVLEMGVLESVDWDEQAEETENLTAEMTASSETLEVPATPDSEMNPNADLDSMQEAMPEAVLPEAAMPEETIPGEAMLEEMMPEQDPLEDKSSEEQNTSLSAEAGAEEVIAEEIIDDGTFIQSLDMGTFIQTNDTALNSDIQSAGSDEQPGEAASAQEHDDSAVSDEQWSAPIEAVEQMAGDLTTDDVIAAVTPPEEAIDGSRDEQPSELFEEGTFIQGMDDGTFVQLSEPVPAAASQAVDAEHENQVAMDSHDLSAQSDSSDPAPTDLDDFASHQSANGITSPKSEEQAEPFEEGTFIQDFEQGSFIQGMTDAEAPTVAPETEEHFEEGTFVQGIDEGTFVQGIDEGTFVQGIDEGTFVQGIDEGTFVQGITDAVGEEEQLVPEAGDEWDSPIDDEAESGSETSNEGEALIPELQAFIDQAAAESAGSVAKATSELVGAEAAIAEPDATDAEAAQASDSAASESQPSSQAEPTEPLDSLVDGAASLESLVSNLAPAEAEVQPSPDAAVEVSQAEPQNVSAAEELVDETTNLPSLETMFAVEPERLAAIANDSLTAELMTAPELEAVQSLQSSESLSSEPLASEPSSTPAPEENVEATAEASSSPVEAEIEAESGAVSAGEPAPLHDVIANASRDVSSDETSSRETSSSETSSSETSSSDAAPPIVNAAVEVALAEHQAVEPRVTINETSPVSEASPAQSDSINDAVMAVEQMFSQLPANSSLPPAQPASTGSDKPSKAAASAPAAEAKTKKGDKKKRQQGTKLSGISVRVDLNVLERMNNLVGELVLSRNSLSMQHEQLQSVVTQLDKRFNNFEGQLNGLRGISDQMLVEPAQRQAAKRQPNSTPAELNDASRLGTSNNASSADDEAGSLLEGFDVLEMDRYSALHGQLQEIFEQLMQLEEGVDDIGVLLEQSTQSLTQQRQRLSLLQNELMWARMLPLDNILGRFPRVLRDMARKHGKSVDLNMNGTSVLVDKGMLEKLHDPMLHLLRNAFDHGIEKPEVREKQGKSKRGEIQINAYYQGNQTVIEIKDNGQGVNLERIAKRAVELQWLSREEIKSIPQQTLLDLIFEPGFSTAAKLSELSGRGVGLDVVREQIKELKGSVTVDYETGKGTTFTLRLPLTLTVAKLMVCQVGTTAIALPSDGIEDLLVPQPEQIKMVGNKRLLHWRDDLIPIHSMSDLLDYSCPTADIASLKTITSNSIPVPKDWALPMLIFSRGSQRCAMEVNRLLMEQELVIKPFSSAITPPEYSYGCTILGDGRMIPVLDGTALLQQLSDNSIAMAAGVELSDELLDDDTLDGLDVTATMAQAMQADTLLVVDDSTAMRRTMALSLEKAGYRVLQAGDGQEALTQLRQSNAIQLVICDVEMPNMNGFEFLSQRRREPMLMKIPVVMLTSRSSDKHRRLAMQLKAHDYFSKPYVEQEFLKSIKQILANQDATAKV